MKICPVCRKLSKDDDFCSHCGSAVYAENNLSSSEQIKCTNYHTHESRESGQLYDSIGAEIKPREKKKITLLGIIKAIALIWILIYFLQVIILVLSAVLGFIG